MGKQSDSQQVRAFGKPRVNDVSGFIGRRSFIGRRLVSMCVPVHNDLNGNTPPKFRTKKHARARDNKFLY
jgi:hypothetical protein